MGQKLTVEGTKIAQAAKDLNVTTVTIRRYVAEFNIKTATDENGIKVLLPKGMEELLAVRQLKEEGLSNAEVLNMLAEKRKSYVASEANHMDINEKTSETDLDTESAEASIQTSDIEEKTTLKADTVENKEDEHEEDKHSEGEEDTLDTKPKHSLTCQTCGKAFEHSNPRLRDCLDCYRTKRKERRRGGSNKHKNVILHPLAQQAANKNALQESNTAGNGNPEEAAAMAGFTETGTGNGRSTHPANGEMSSEHPRTAAPGPGAVPAVQRGGGNTPVRNYRKAIDETRQITSSLKRRLERPDLPEGERRWLEQVYAYQLILHQGWRHLSEYKALPAE